MLPRLLMLPGLLILTVVAAGCSDNTADTQASTGDGPTVVVTTDILGDVVSNMVGDEARVEVLVPTGTPPHDFQPSARQAAAMRSADVLVINGAGLEAGLLDTITAAESDGIPVCTAIDGVDTLDLDDPDHPDGPADAEDVDPHFFTDPARVATAVEHLAGCMARAVPELVRTDLRQNARAYSEELTALDAELEDILAVVPAQRRVLVTDHEVFGYFADRYGFEVLGTIIPSTSSQAQADAASLSDLISLVEAEGTPAVFVSTTSSPRLAESLASQVGDVEVVELFSETLGPDGADTYTDMMRTNARRITDALT